MIPVAKKNPVKNVSGCNYDSAHGYRYPSVVLNRVEEESEQGNDCCVPHPHDEVVHEK